MSLRLTANARSMHFAVRALHALRRRPAPALTLLLLAAVLSSGASPYTASSADFATEESLTGGIQEAIDSLPRGGGTVYVPEGVHELRRTLWLPPGTRLTGAGKGSVIRKADGWMLRLSEDVTQGADQNYVVVEDASRLKPGMFAVVTDKAGDDGDVIIDAVAGNRVFLRRWNMYSVQRADPWTPKRDLLVERGAILCSAFPMVRTTSDCVISDLCFDGNKEGQMVAGEPLYKEYGKWWNRLRIAPYNGGNTQIRHCWLENAPGVAVSFGNTGEIRDCEISGCNQGVHPGEGPYVKIIGNRIHHNEHAAIMLCLGTYGMIISQNHLYDNAYGLFHLTCPDNRPGRDGDHFSIVSQNVIYRNRHAAIQCASGSMTPGMAQLVGPRDFIFSENIIMNNTTARDRSVQAHRIPAAMCLFNPQRCVITNNRVFDDQDAYWPFLGVDVEPGATVLPVRQEPAAYSLPMRHEEWTDFAVLLSDGERAERVQVESYFYDGADTRAWVMKLARPIQFGYAAGIPLKPLKSQAWGIFAGGPRAEQNVIANNVVSGNAIGGILWSGTDTAVSGNVGRVVQLDPERLPAEQVFPPTGEPLLSDPGFEEGAWQLEGGATLDADVAHSGDRSLRLPDEAAEAISAEFAIRPNTLYRVTAWVRTDAKQGEKLLLPNIVLDAPGVANPIVRVLPAIGPDFEPAAVEPAKWVCVLAEGPAGATAERATLRCTLPKGAEGSAWVDDIELTSVEAIW